MFWELILPLILITAAFLFICFLSVSEITLVSIRSAFIDDLIAKGSQRAEYLRRLRANPERLFAFFRFCKILTIAFISIFAVELIAGPITHRLGQTLFVQLTAAKLIAYVTATLLIAAAIYFIAGLCSRRLSITKRNSFALFIGAPTWYSIRAVTPFIAAIDFIKEALLRTLGLSTKSNQISKVAEPEIRLILRDGLERDVFSDQEQKILYSLLEFSDTTVRRAMTPRTDIVAFDINAPIEDLLKMATEEQYSRYPVYDEKIDNIKGIVHSRDLLYVFAHRELFVLKDIIREARFVPDSKPIAELFREMKKDKFHMAVVLDEFGGTSGIITMEDIIEEIIGDIQDEYDKEISKIIFLDRFRARVKASMPVDEFADEFGVEIEEGDYDTVAGMAINKLGRIPSSGERVLFDGFYLEIAEKDGHKIKWLIAFKTAQS